MRNLCLKVLWLESSISFAIDQSLGDKTIPLTEFYIWPIKDAWVLIKCDLERLNWVSESEAVLMLNTITNIINDWQVSSDLGSLNSANLKNNYPGVFFIGVL